MKRHLFLFFFFFTGCLSVNAATQEQLDRLNEVYKAYLPKDYKMVRLDVPGEGRWTAMNPAITSIGSEGEYAVVWELYQHNNELFNSFIMFQKFNSNGKAVKKKPAIISRNGITNGRVAYDPEVSSLNSEKIVVAWYDPKKGSAYLRQFNPDLSVLRSPMLLSKVTGYPVVSFVGARGEYVVAGKAMWGRSSPVNSFVGAMRTYTVAGGTYTAAASPSANIYLQKFNPHGTTTNQPLIEIKNSSRLSLSRSKPKIVPVGMKGDYILAFEGEDKEGDHSIFVQKINANNSKTTQIKLEAIGNYKGDDLYSKVTTVGTEGEYVVAWQGVDREGDYSVFVQKFNEDGTITNQNRVRLEGGGDVGRNDTVPDIASVGTKGEFVVVWQGRDKDSLNGLYDSIFVQKFNSNGSLTNYKQVKLANSKSRLLHNRYPRVTSVGTKGEFVVVWQGQDLDDQHDYSVYVQKFNSDGTIASQNRVKLEAIGDTMGDDLYPQITSVGTKGEYVVAWHAQQYGSKDYSVYIQKFNANGSVSSRSP